MAPKLTWGQWRPDVSDLDAAEFTRLLSNVIPRGDGYGPINALETYSAALPAACRGAFAAQKSDGSILIFAGTVNNLYLMSNTTFEWTEVSKGGADYTDLPTQAQWSFAQFGAYVIAVQQNTVPQYYLIGTSTAFADLAGSPPTAGYVSTVGPFVVLSDLVSTPYNIWWSALNSVVGWTAGTDRSDFQEMPDGGRVRCVLDVGHDIAFVMQEGAIRRMTYVPGSSVVFQIDKIGNAPGVIGAYSACLANGGIHYVSTRGFMRVDASGLVTPVGEERVNRTFLGQHETSVPADLLALGYDASSPKYVIGVPDPTRSVVVWVYRGNGSTDSLFTRGMIYHTTLDRWAPVEFSGEYLFSTARPGLTLEALDAIAPGAQAVTGAANNGAGLIRLTVGSTAAWATSDVKTVSGVGGVTNANGTWTITVVDATHIDLQGSTFAGVYTSGGTVGGSVDAMTFSLDDIEVSSLPSLAGFTSAHKLAFFTGDALESTMQTAEVGLDGARMNINWLLPITDAATAYASASIRTKLAGAATDSDESLMDADGYCYLLSEGRYARATLRIPAATVWTFASGVRAGIEQAGEY